MAIFDIRKIILTGKESGASGGLGHGGDRRGPGHGGGGHYAPGGGRHGDCWLPVPGTDV